MRGFPVSYGDALQISSWNALASVGLTIRGYTRGSDGTISPFSAAHVPNTDRTIASTLVGLPDGELVNASVFVSAAAPIIGQTFVRLQLVRGLGSAGIALATLAAGYVTAVQPLAFPGSGVARSVDGPGAIRNITGTNPAAGAEVVETVPVWARWMLRGFGVVFVTDATVTNRETHLTIDNGTTIVYESGVNAVSSASQTVRTVLSSGDTPTTSSSVRVLNGPGFPLTLLAGSRIGTLTPNLQAGDDYGAPQLLVEEWLEGAT